MLEERITKVKKGHLVLEQNVASKLTKNGPESSNVRYIIIFFNFLHKIDSISSFPVKFVCF